MGEKKKEKKDKEKKDKEKKEKKKEKATVRSAPDGSDKNSTCPQQLTGVASSSAAAEKGMIKAGDVLF